MTTKILPNKFENRYDLINHVQNIAPWAKGSESKILGGRNAAEEKLQAINPVLYGKTRNFVDGHITKLSPYIRHGILSLNEVRNHALRSCEDISKITKFIQELAWRDFWQRIYAKHPDWMESDIEPHKTGFVSEDYSHNLPDDIIQGKTGISCIDSFIDELTRTGYIHNHARMYLASYIVHFRRVKWQVGASWFLMHLLDGDPASNNLSWQWVASTFSSKPYIFNLENVDKYFGRKVDTNPVNNQLLHATYEELNIRLFPKMNLPI
ncbi:MAG: deoxyribodipyrimidine photo-lyase [Rickettsiales bacterium]|jgi:deoxyribodipyrimidine photo-lyase